MDAQAKSGCPPYSDGLPSDIRLPFRSLSDFCCNSDIQRTPSWLLLDSGLPSAFYRTSIARSSVEGVHRLLQVTVGISGIRTRDRRVIGNTSTSSDQLVWRECANPISHSWSIRSPISIKSGWPLIYARTSVEMIKTASPIRSRI